MWSRQVTIRVNGAPANGFVGATPSKGYAGYTQFQLQATQWVDEEEVCSIPHTCLLALVAFNL